MPVPELEATAHLKTIRALMERATVYRAISAPGGLGAGVLSLLVCGWLLRQEPSHRIGPMGLRLVMDGGSIAGVGVQLLAHLSQCPAAGGSLRRAPA